MSIIGKHLERHGINILAFVILGKVEFDEVATLQRLAIDRVLATMLPQPWEDVGKVEDGAVGGADGVLEGLEGEGAEVVWEALEVGGWAGRLARVGAGGGAEGIGAGPFAVRDLGGLCQRGHG